MAENAGVLDHHGHGEIDDVVQSVEKLVTETQTELDKFKHEQVQLRTQLNEILEENNQGVINMEQKRYSAPENHRGSGDDVLAKRAQLTHDALTNTRQQVDLLLNEKNNLVEINEYAQRTIQNLEVELNQYRQGLCKSNEPSEQLKRKYCDIVAMLKQEICQLKAENTEQVNLIRALHEHKLRNHKDVDALEHKLNSQQFSKEQAEASLVKLEQQLAVMTREKTELEKSVSYTKSLLEETTKREAVAMRKVQESIIVAEAAMQEKREAKNRAETYREECTQLATNIGIIMDQAAKQVDNEVSELKFKIEDKEKCLSELRKKLADEQELFKKQYQTLEMHYNIIEEKYKAVQQHNVKLLEELKKAASNMHELEQKLEKSEDFRLEQRQQQAKLQYECQMGSYISIKKELKAKFQLEINDLTTQFEKEFHRLKKENSELKAGILPCQTEKLASMFDVLAEAEGATADHKDEC